MTLRLNGLGKLIDGVDEAAAMAALQRLTGLSEEKVKEQLLNGQVRKLVSADNREEIEALREQLSEAGLQVELVDEDATPNTAVESPRRSLFSRILPVFVFILAVALGAAGYGWYWLHRAPGPDVLVTESTLADGSLVAIGHVDVNKIVTLRKAWLGELDPQAMPLPDSKQALIKHLFEGPANFTENLDHLFIAIHASSEGRKTSSTLLLNGRFDVKTVISALENDYNLTSLGESRWSLRPKMKSASGISCPEPKEKKEAAVTHPDYLHMTSHQLMLSDSSEQIDYLLSRFASTAPLGQNLDKWRDYRSGQLAGLMVFMPGDASKAIKGFEGMLLQKAAKETPEVKYLGMRVGVSPLNAGVLAGVNIGSQNAAWNSESAKIVRDKLAEWMKDSQGISPAMGQLLSRIAVEDSTEQLQLELALDSEMLSEVGKVVEEGVASLFSVTVSSGDKAQGPISDQLDNSPIDYTANASLAQLPDYTVQKHETMPLFLDSSFAVDVDQLALNKDGLFELKVKGKVALPKVEYRVQRLGSFSMWVDDVVGANGQSLLRDEHCLDGPLWKRNNHEAEITTHLFGDSVTAHKTVRLKQGVSPVDIETVKGRLTFSAPVTVKQFDLPYRVGASIEHMGMRFYINRLKDGRSVSYQVSGKSGQFAELRALNVDGKPLRKGWRMGSEESGRYTQQYEGTIHALQLFVTESTVEKSLPFTLSHLWEVPTSEDEQRKLHWYAPSSLPAQEWDRYARLDMTQLHADPNDKNWHRWGGEGEPLATLGKQPVEMVWRHQPKEWGNHPEVDLYFPQLNDMPGVLSLLSYEVEIPANEKTGKERFVEVFLPYYSGRNGGESKVVVNHHIDGMPFAHSRVFLEAGLDRNEKAKRLKGAFRFRLPTKTESTKLNLSDLWQGVNVGGVSIKMMSMSRGIFSGYQLQVEGALGSFVNLHGLDESDRRIVAEPVDFQSGGYWTLTLPFGQRLNRVELVLATEQRIYDYPFDLRPEYAVVAQ